MTLDEAIKLLEDLRDFSPVRNAPNTKAAMELGIEVLKQLRKYRAYPPGVIWEALPGETERGTGRRDELHQ